MTGLCSKYDFINYRTGLTGVFLKIISQSLAYGRRYSTLNFAIAELSLCLAFKLRFEHLDRDYSGKAFAEVIA